MLSASSLFLILIFGLGNLPLHFLAPSQSKLDRIACAFALGLILNYTLILLGLPFGVLQWVLLSAGVLGSGLFAWSIKKNKVAFPYAPAFFILYLGVLFFIKITAEGNPEWDARICWFFNAKLIWLADGITSKLQLTHPSFIWSHPDHPEFGSLVWPHPSYPKLVPALAAQIAHYFGFWSDYLVRISIFIVIVPTILTLAQHVAKRLSFVLLCLVLYGSSFAFLWNGYMDGLISLYAGTIVWSLTQRRFLIAVLLSALMLQIKNEGMLLFLCIWTGYALTHWNLVKTYRFKHVFSLAATLVPVMIWTVRKNMLGVVPEYLFLTQQTLQRSMERILDGSLVHAILNTVLIKNIHTWKVVLLFSMVTVVHRMILKRKLSSGIVFPIFAGSLYLAGLILVYLTTPYLLSFQLNTSVDRTTIAFVVLILLGVVQALRSIEGHENDQV